MTDPIILCENLVKIYKVADLEVLALQGLDLSVQRGELMGIVGVSGSGKSTLMNVLGGLVRPSAGRVVVDGYELLKLSSTALDRYRRTRVGFVWQEGARNLIPYLDALENVQMPMTLAGTGGKRARQQAEALLDMVGLSDRRHHYLAELSGGEQQRVAIAVALANHPAILLADEPTGELDSATALTVYQAFQNLNQELGLTILIVSHDPAIAQHVQRVMAIRDGKAASETVRARRPDPSREGPPTGEDHDEEHFEELVVLDSAGRLQVPKAYREALQIKGRVRMELVDGHLVIHSVAEAEYARQTAARPKSPGAATPTTGRRPKWLARWRRNKP
ncbi:MAG: ABC transporter ATP-binding protein [Chloroflexi bacterium]|nr:ABC transporter ATP-binding protein [Chloroflexota bacterium]MCI0576924.1 ABC transporter ATP-binding protein [Chloroflexota bacterium]MCI0646928.1 ABC transporter ATP-binding protein [Chloroflexota bacterium]MCI0731308.1 ABC transporter ATP-binding protein [Chloroflexota bacterium]